MAEMEAEAILVGPWRNFEELEECINIEELNLIIKAAHDREHRAHKFMAALKGIDLDKNDNNKSAFERAKLRADARLAGMSEEEMEEHQQVQTLTSWGFKIEKEVEPAE